MEKNYEYHGVPKYIGTQMAFEDMPEYVSAYYVINEAVFDSEKDDDDQFESRKGFPRTSFQIERGLPSPDLSLWLSASKWTALEAALLLAGVNPNDDELYAAVKHIHDNDIEHRFLLDFDNIEPDYVTWKYEYEFEFAADLIFLFERSYLGASAKPYDWFLFLVHHHVGIKLSGFYFLVPPIAKVLSDFSDFFALLFPKEVNKITEKSLAPKERDTLLKIIGGLAIGGHGMDIHAPRLNGIADMLDDLARVGVAVDQDTLSKHLKAAAQLISKPKSV